MTTINLSWKTPVVDSAGRPYNAIKQLDSYDLQMQVEGAPSFTSIAAPAANATSFAIDTDAPGSYSFQLFAIGKNGKRSAPAAGSVTIADNATPGAPTEFTVTLS